MNAITRSTVLIWLTVAVGGCGTSTQDRRIIGVWLERERDGTASIDHQRDSDLEIEFSGKVFAVTRLQHRFETYKDYWGTYSVAKPGGTLNLDIEGGNAVPAKFQGKGSYHFEPNGDLVLKGIDFGFDAAPASSARVFRRERQE